MKKAKRRLHHKGTRHTKKAVPHYFGVDIHHIALGVAAIGTLVLVLLVRELQ